MKEFDQYNKKIDVDILSKSVLDFDSVTDDIKGVKICVVGAGFVGTVTAAGLANFGHDVVCVEKDHNKLSMLRSGRLPFYERDLEQLVKNGLSSGHLSFENDLEQSIEGMKAVFLTVGTPSSREGRADLTAINEIAARSSKVMNSKQIFVLKSTVPVGTADSIKGMLNTNGNDSGISVISNPEFLREGSAVHDFYNPHRIVIGGDSKDAMETIANIYRFGLHKPIPIFATDNKTAEMIKYASNVFLATKVSFINELSRLCDRLGVNAIEIARIIGVDPRIGPSFLNPGPGWGGSCLPKDLSEFIGLANSLGVTLHIPQAVREANSCQFEHIISKVKEVLGDLNSRKISALGLTFKANTSDLRESPAISILSGLQAEGAVINAFDPAAGGDFSEVFSGVNRFSDPYEASRGADCVIILTEWPDFQLLDWKKMGEVLKMRNLIDTRNIIDPKYPAKFGFRCVGVGHNHFSD